MAESLESQLADISQVVPIWLAQNRDEAVTAMFNYRPRDPHAVTALFATRHGESRWTFARDLLRDGLIAPTGEGDVRISPAPGGQIFLDLSSPDGMARLVCDRTAITWFVDQIFATVPDGDESSHLQVDDWLARLSL